MSEMLERCARAAEDALADALVLLCQTGDGPYPHDFENVARAVLEALREPTPQMTEAGEYDDNSPPGECGRYITEDMGADVWRRMIDTALKDTSE